MTTPHDEECPQPNVRYPEEPCGLARPCVYHDVQQKPVFTSNERADKLIAVLREIEVYHVALVSKRKRRNDPEKSWRWQERLSSVG